MSLAAKGVCVAVVSSGLFACSDSGDPIRIVTSPEVPVAFSHGVASGDPTQEAVILWTRLSAQDASYTGSLPVSWEIASDEAFSNVISNGFTTVTGETDYTVKVDAIGLEAATTYYYRFQSGDTISAIGKAKTLPGSGVEQVVLAAMSCSNYPAGFFNVYDMAAKRNDIDAVLHLGDYIYEYARDGYASDRAAELGREVLPAHEIVSLSDYRTRYAQYRSDTSLQTLHATVPFICVWDDHEVTNDTYKDGAENHQPEEGDFEQRKMDALQAYFEWMPIRPVVDGDNTIINRSFQFGDLVDVYMLDTRIIARDEQLSYGNYIDPATGALNTDAFVADVSDPNRTLLGATQRQWLLDNMATSGATWQVLGQQVLMGRMNLPAAVVTQQLSIPQYAELGALAVLAQRVAAGDPTLTQAEIDYFLANQSRLTPEVLALLQLPQIPYNLDAWDGYAAEREMIFGAAKQLNKNLVVLAGDTHNAWANDLKDFAGDTIGVEFATPGVTSPGLESFLNIAPENVVSTEQGLVGLVEDLRYLNGSDRGFMTVTFTRDSVQANWHFVDTILSETYSELTDRAASAQSAAGSPAIQLG